LAALRADDAFPLLAALAGRLDFGFTDFAAMMGTGTV
jgi:hypothetical protein